MKRKVAVACLVASAGVASLRADFSYEQNSKITGGMMAGAMKVMGAFSKQAREPIHSTVLFKGNRMAHVSSEHASIIDLDSETITDINFRDKTYSVITFEQMKQALEKMAANKDAQSPDVNFKASVKETGQTREIGGLKTNQVILKLEMEGTDQKSGQKGSMVTTSDMWMAPDVSGYEEARSFYKRMAQKIAWAPGGAMFTQGRSDMAKAFADLAKESSKLSGVPVLQVVRMGAEASGQPAQGQAPSEQARKQDQEQPSVGAALGRLGGLGGLGGFGRKKKKQEEPKQEEAAAPPQESGAASGVLMEVTTESSNFSTASVDASRLQTPAGFKQVESPIVKHAK